MPQADLTALSPAERLAVRTEALVDVLVTKGTFTAAELQTALDNIDSAKVLRRQANRADHATRVYLSVRP
jgi:hypothetical protein